METSEQLASLREAMDELTHTEHDAIYLQNIEGWTLDKISDYLGISVPATKSLLFRTRKKLAQKLAIRDRQSEQIVPTGKQTGASMNSKPDPKQDLQKTLDDLRDQILSEIPETDQQAFLARLRQRIEEAEATGAGASVQVEQTRWKRAPLLLAAAVLLGIVTALLQPWNQDPATPVEAPPVALLEDLDVIRALAQLDSTSLASLTAVDLGAATLVYENEADVPFDLLLAAVEEEE
ncbi:MAG: RNA polymerase sigma factor [Planctomycetota bacterium]